jgi:hypothetical protein
VQSLPLVQIEKVGMVCLVVLFQHKAWEKSGCVQCERLLDRMGLPSLLDSWQVIMVTSQAKDSACVVPWSFAKFLSQLEVKET